MFCHVHQWEIGVSQCLDTNPSLTIQIMPPWYIGHELHKFESIEIELSLGKRDGAYYRYDKIYFSRPPQLNECKIITYRDPTNISGTFAFVGYPWLISIYRFKPVIGVGPIPQLSQGLFHLPITWEETFHSVLLLIIKATLLLNYQVWKEMFLQDMRSFLIMSWPECTSQ